MLTEKRVPPVLTSNFENSEKIHYIDVYRVKLY